MKRICVQTEAGLVQMLEHLDKHKEIGLDYETRPGWWSEKPIIAGVGFAVHQPTDGGYIGYYVPLNHDVGLLDRCNLPEGVFWSKAGPLYESQRHLKIAHGAEVESGLTKLYGYEMGTSVRCSQIATWLYDEETYYPYRLKEVVPKILGRPIKTVEEHLGGKVKDYGTIPIDVMTLYNTDDTIHSLMLHQWCEPELRRQGLEEDYLRLEIPLIQVLRDMVIRGVRIDLVEAHKQLAGVMAKQKELEEHIYRLAEHPFNLNSRDQLAAVIFKELGYPYPEEQFGRTKTGKYKTDDAVMAWLEEEADCEVAKQYRVFGDLAKFKGTYLEALINGVDSDGRYHPSFWQCGTKTGRFSSDFQQVPRDAEEYKLARPISDLHHGGRVWEFPKFTDFTVDIRKLIVPEEGKYLLVADYNQVELRLLAHFSQDPVLLGSYLRGEDLHQGTADILGIERADAKAVNFGLAYGLTLQSLIELFGEEKARAAFPLLRERYRVLLKYTQAAHKYAHETECMRSLSGRRRRLPFINLGDSYQRSHAERQAFNFMIQGSAADIVKLAQKTLAYAVPEFKMLLQVHDELVGEVSGPLKYAKQVAAAVQEVMEQVVKLSVPLVVAPKVAPNWREGK